MTRRSSRDESSARQTHTDHWRIARAGRELALAFAREGAAGLALAARNNDALDEVRARVRELAPETRVLTINADLTRQAQIERVIATTLSEFGGQLDVLVNNASALG